MRKFIYLLFLLGVFQASAAEIPPAGKWCHVKGFGNSVFQKDVKWSLDYSLTGGGAGGRGGYTFEAVGWLNINGNFSGDEDIWIEWSPTPFGIERKSMKLNFHSGDKKFTGNLGNFHIKTIPTGSNHNGNYGNSFEGGLDLTININGQRLSLSEPFGVDNEITMVAVGVCDP
ncbi:MAG: hypothetical protein ACXVCY_08830 [Pseudobdellovibrionaceae bacterium]